MQFVFHNFGAVAHRILGMRLLHPFRPVYLQGVKCPGRPAQAVQLGTAAAPAHSGRLDPGACPWPCDWRIRRIPEMEVYNPIPLILKTPLETMAGREIPTFFGDHGGVLILEWDGISL